MLCLNLVGKSAPRLLHNGTTLNLTTRGEGVCVQPLSLSYMVKHYKHFYTYEET
jgi:hypothetical protein